MRLRINALMGLGVTLALIAGCEEPKEIVPVAPPGFELTRMPSTPQGEGAQALGEQRAPSPNRPENKAAAPGAGGVESLPTPIGQPRTTPSGLTYETLKEGSGVSAKPGDQVSMHYTGTLLDGTKFDSSVDRGQPFDVQIGMGNVIRGWDEGVPGMKVGEKRKLTIPANIGYGPAGKGKIPPNATMNFEVELLGIR